MHRKVVLVLVLSLIVTIFSACSGTDAKPELKSDGYPPAPPTLMQAELAKINGGTLKLEDYKGKVLLVNVWATWCGPCRAEIPQLIELQNKNKEKGLEVIGLNLDEEDTAEMIKDFGKEMSVNYELVRGEGKLFEEFFKVSKKDAIPQSFLIDREGKLLGVFVGGGASLRKLIENTNKVVGG